ncbi:MAG: hypothetical protein ABWX94_01115 [Candidatus Saccharimonadales bacterium]
MSKNFYSRVKSRKGILFALLLVVVVVVVGIVSVVRAPGSDDKTPANDQRITRVGRVVCLPHKNSDGPQTLECAMGLKAEDGKHYALKDEDSPAGESLINGVFNKHVEVSGLFNSSNETIYDIAGTITIVKLKVLE